MKLSDMNDEERTAFNKENARRSHESRAKNTQEALDDAEDVEDGAKQPSLAEKVLMAKPGLVIILGSAAIVGSVVYHKQIRAAVKAVNLSQEDLLTLAIGYVVASNPMA